MTRFLHRTGRWAALHPWRAIAGWFAFTALLLGLAAGFGGTPQDNWNLPGTEAQDEALINSLSMVLPFSPGDRQALLESPTLSDRRELLQGLIEFALHGGDTEDRLQ